MYYTFYYEYKYDSDSVYPYHVEGFRYVSSDLSEGELKHELKAYIERIRSDVYDVKIRGIEKKS